MALNPLEVDDMAHAIAWIFGLVRPYAVAHERRRESRPRVRLVRASHGTVVAQ